MYHRTRPARFCNALAPAAAVILLTLPGARDADAADTPPAQIAGQVQLPDGRPAGDAPVVVYWRKLFAQTRTNAEGRFELSLDPEQIVAELGTDDWKRGCIAAGKKGYAPEWVLLRDVREGSLVTIRLVEDLPVRGRILDQQGQPVPDAEVRLASIFGSRGGDEKILDGFLQTNRDDPTELWIYTRDRMQYLADVLLPVLLEVGELGETVLHTQEDGGFELAGIGRERAVMLHVSGPDIASQSVYVITRPEIDARWNRGTLSRQTKMQLESGATMPVVYPATFRHLAEPGLVIAGTVRDAHTNEPIEGMRVSCNIRGSSSGSSSTTDAQGRYRLSGLKAEGELSIAVLNPGDKPWLDAARTLAVRADQQPGDIDFELNRGVVVSGRVTQLETGEPVRGWVDYLAWPDNPQLAELAEPYDSHNTMMTNERGEYRIVVPPGPGVLSFRARDRQFDVARPEDFGFPLYESGSTPTFSSANWGLVVASHYHALKRIEPEASVTHLSVDLAASAGMPITVRLLDADGQPFEGRVKAYGIVDGVHDAEFDGPTASLRGLKPGEERTVFFRDREHRVAAVHTFRMPAEGPAEEAVVRLEACGVVSGRLVDQDGRPLSRRPVAVMSSGVLAALKQGQGFSQPGLFELTDDVVHTDADGYFRAAGIPAGHSFEVIAIGEESSDPAARARLLYAGMLRPGQQLDLEAVRYDEAAR